MIKYLLFFVLTYTTLFSYEKYKHTYSTYFGGNHFEQARDLAIDKQGNVIIVGGTSSIDFPTTEGAFMREYNNAGSETIGSWGPMMGFIAKFSPEGNLLFSTLLGGPNYDRCYAVEVDEDGYIYVGGRAGDDFPTTPGVAQEFFFKSGNVGKNNLYGHQNGFIAKLSPDGSELIWATYYGGDNLGFFRDIDIDDEGNVYGILNAVLGTPPGINTDSFDNSHNGGHDMVVVKFSGDGSKILWASYIGGSDDDTGGPSIRVGKDNSVYVAGGTKSVDMPISENAAQKDFGGTEDMFVARFAPDGKSLIYCTYIGGSNIEVTETHGLAIDDQGRAYIACSSKSDDFPVSSNAIKQTNTNGVHDCLLVKISIDGTEFLAASYFGGDSNDGPEGLAVDNDGNLYFGGESASSDMPTTDDAIYPNFLGNTDAYIAKVNSDFSEILYCSYYGGSNREAVRAFGLDRSRNRIAFSGQTQSTDLETTENAFQKSYTPPINRANVFLSYFELEPISSVELKAEKNISIAPNPSSNIIYFNGTLANSNYSIFTSNGTLIKSGVINNSLNVEDLSNGKYFIYLESVDKTESFIIER